MTRLVSLDIETHLIKPGQAFPRTVCLTHAERPLGPPSWASIQVGLLGREDGIRFARDLLRDPDVHIVGHSIPYDLGCLAADVFEDQGQEAGEDFLRLVFDAIEAGRVHDTEIRQKLLDISAGIFKFEIGADGSATKHTYRQADLEWRYFQRDRFGEKSGPTADEFLAKYPECWGKPPSEWPPEARSEPWRLRFSMLDGIPVEDWPEEAKRYALEDAGGCLEVCEAQATEATRRTPDEGGDPSGAVPDEDSQVGASWVLRLMAGWGIRTEPSAVASVKAALEAERDAAAVVLREAGIMRADGSKDMKRIQALVADSFVAQGRECPLTDGGKSGNRKPKTDEETLRETGDPGLLVLADSTGGAKLLTTYVPVLEGGLVFPITSRPNALVDTGRTSWAKPNLQNPPRKGGIRECFVPRPGYVFGTADYSTIELCALAQTCLDLFGHSEMAAALQAGRDLHLDLAADLLGITYEDAQARLAAGDPVVAEARQSAKAANFGFPGGMGPETFLATQRETVKNSPSLAALDPVQLREWSVNLREAWKRKWSEMPEYFQNAGYVTDPLAPGRVRYPWAFVRGGLDYCSCANGYFQSRTAAGGKRALWSVVREAYVDRRSALYGCRPEIFIHDEIFMEAPEDRAADAAGRLSEVMIARMAEVIPDIPIKVDAVLMRRWYKGAKPVRVDGRLVPSRPQKDAAGRTHWVADLPAAPLAAAA